MRDLEKLNVAKGRGNNERRGCSFFCYLLNLFKCFYRSWKMKKKNNPLCVPRDTCSNLLLPILKTSGEQHTLSERRKSMYLFFSCLCCQHIVVRSEKWNIEFFCIDSCSKLTTKINCCGGLNKVRGLEKFSKTNWRRSATIR